MIRKIRKRDGKIADFNPIRITNAIWKAAQAVGGKDHRKAAELTDKVLETLENNLEKGEIPTVEKVQDCVEKTLIEEGHAKTAKAYILYRHQHRDIREIGGLLKDIDVVDGYLSMMDWKVQENSNMAYSLQGLNVYATENIISHYWLNKIYPPEIGDAHTKGSYHIHDLGTLGAYTYFGKETIIARTNDKIFLTSFQNLYEKLNYDEDLLSEKDDAWAKYPDDLEVLDKEGWTKVKRVVKKAKNKPMRFIKNEGGRSVIVTEDHPMVLGDEIFKEAKDVKTEQDSLLTIDIPTLLKKEKLFSKKHIFLAEELYNNGIFDFFIEGMPFEEYNKYSDKLDIDGVISTSNNADALPNKIELTENLGYLIGFYLAEGSIGPHRISISQKDTVENQQIIKKLQKAAYELGCRLYSLKKDGFIDLRIVNTTFVKYLLEKTFNIKGTSKEKHLPDEILNYNQDFVEGVLAGVIDGDGSITTSKTSLVVRIASRTMLEQMSTVMNILGFTVRDRNLEGVGSTRYYNDRQIIQYYPLYGISFRTIEKTLPSFKYNSAEASSRAWRAEGSGWHKILNNETTEIADDYIYDITTETHTLVVNGMWNHNCVGWDLKDILLLGFRGVSGKIESKPAKHFGTALMQVVNYLYTLQGEAAGAQALSNFDSLLAPFIKYDKLNYGQVKQEMQKFLFNMNVPTRVGFQSPFSNCTLDLTVPSYMKDEPAIIGGELKDDNYSDFTDEMDMINHAFAEVMNEGDAKGRPFSVDGNCLCPIKNSGDFKLVRIGEYIDSIMEKKTPMYIKENNCQVMDITDEGIKCLGMKNGKISWHNINYIVRHPQKELLKITTKGGFNVNVTPSHSVFVLKQGKIIDYPASKLKYGDYLISPRTVPSEIKDEQISLAEKFIKKDKINGVYISGVKKEKQEYKEKRFCNGKHKYCYKVSAFPLKNISEDIKDFDLSEAKLNLAGSNIKIKNYLDITKELSEFLGWYCAEGSAEKGTCGGISLSFNLKKEKKEAQHIVDLTKKIFGDIPIKIRKIKERNLIEVRIHSKLIRRIITEIFDIKNDIGKKVPRFIFEVSPEKKKMFLNAYFKGDAYITEDIVANSKSEDLIYGISTVLKQLNVFHTINEYKSKGRIYWRMNIWNNNDLEKKDPNSIAKIPIEESGLGFIAEKIVEKKPFFYDSMHRKYKNTKKRVLKKFDITHQCSAPITKTKKLIKAAKDLSIKIPQALKEIEENNLLFLKIKEINTIETSNGMVYDFSTDTENFVAHQFLVHNTFPIPTYNITKDFDWDNAGLDPIWEMTAKYGVPYFSNFINSDMRPDDARSMCCRLRLDNRELRKRGGGLFGANPKTGSIGVVTINMPQIGYLSKDDTEFFERLDALMDLAKESLVIKREVIENLTFSGLHPYSKFYLSDVKKTFGEYWKNHFSTIGVIGMNDALLNFMNKSIADPQGKAFAEKVLDHMRDKLADYQQETGDIFNLEATPAEGASYRLSRIDKAQYPDIRTYNQEFYGNGGKVEPYYTNSTQLPVGFTDDIFEALDLQDSLQSKYTGGTVLHVFLGENEPDFSATKKLVRKIAQNYTLPYFTMTPTFSICPKHGYLAGEHKYCPKCDEELGINKKMKIVARR
jgi:anaerobic ribonucleoside-triphosphate reductase